MRYTVVNMTPTQEETIAILKRKHAEVRAEMHRIGQRIETELGRIVSEFINSTDDNAVRRFSLDDTGSRIVVERYSEGESRKKK